MIGRMHHVVVDCPDPLPSPGSIQRCWGCRWSIVMTTGWWSLPVIYPLAWRSSVRRVTCRGPGL